MDMERFVADKKPRVSTVVKILSYQILVTVCITVGYAILFGWQNALSPALGGLAAIIPNFYFALRIYKVTGQEPKKIVRAFYVGEAGKLVLTGIFFVIILQIPTLQVLPLFAGYAAALSVFWFALLMR